MDMFDFALGVVVGILLPMQIKFLVGVGMSAYEEAGKCLRRVGFLVLLLLIPSLSFAQGLPLKDGNSSSLADIQACGAENCVRATGPTTASGAGYEGLVGISGDSPATVNGKRYNAIQASEGGGIRTATPNILWDDTFNATSQNTAKYRFGSTTMTGAQAGGYLILNNSSITTVNTNAAMQTFRTFPLFAKNELRITMSAMHTTAPQSNAVTEWGFFTMGTLPNATAPTDGCFFRFNAAAEFRGVCSYNTTEVQTTAITATSANVNHDYTIVVQTNAVIFYVDNAVVGTITILTDAPSLGQPFIQAAIPITFRHINSAVAPSLAMQFKVSDVFVISMGPDLNRDWETQKAGFGHMGSQGQNGGTMGTTANTGNGATPAASALTNTAISTGSPVGLGGLAHVLPTLTAGTDGILFSFQNPLGGVNQTPRTLVIKGVALSGGVDLVLTGGPLSLVYSLAYGHTAISMATAETASFTTPGPTTKAPRRVWLGVHNAIAAAVAGTALGPSDIVRTFSSPIVVAPGEFVAITVRNQGVVTSAGSVVITAAFDAYYE